MADAHASGGRGAQGSAGRSFNLGHLALAYIVFAIVCLITGYVVSSASSSTPLTVKNDHVHGPFKVEKDGTVLKVEVAADRIPRNTWTFIEVEVLDAAKKRLFSFGDQLSRYEGYDGEYWVEEKKSYSAKTTIDKAGTYHLRFKVQGRATLRGRLMEIYGSSIPYYVAGVAALLSALVLNEIQNRAIVRTVRRVRGAFENAENA